MDNKKISFIGELRNDASLMTPELVLRDAMQEFDVGQRWSGWPKVLVIALDDRDGNYRIGFTQAGLRCSEMVSLIEVLKVKMLAHMGFV